MAGSITTLGIGSGLDLQNILDQLKTAEKAPITRKENEKAGLQNKINAYNSVNSKLFSMKSHALSLSLESDFLKNKAAVSDEEILTATANNGIETSSHTIEVVQKAQFSSWQTAGVAGKDAVIIDGPDTGIKSKNESVTTSSGTMAIKYGALESQQDINIDLNPGMSLTDVVARVNSSEANKDEEGNLIVMASVGTNSKGDFYVRLAAASGEDAVVDSQISVEGADFARADVTVSIGLDGSEDPMYLHVAPGTTYEQIAADINAASDNPGVTATIVDTGTSENPFKLTLTANKTGESNRIKLQTLDTIMTEATGAGGESLNAIFKVSGVEYQRQSNTGITDVISGVTLTLKKTGETSLGIQRDLDPIKESITALIDGFNSLVSEIKEGAESNSENEKKTEDTDAPLSDSFEMKTMISKLESLITTTVDTDSEYISLVDLGLEVNKDGTMTLNETVLEQAVTSHPDAVKELFIGDAEAGVTGLGDIIDDGITGMVSSYGLVSTEIDKAETRMDGLDKDIETTKERLEKKYETMTAEFVRLDSYISSLNSQAKAMNSIIESFTKTTQK